MKYLEQPLKQDLCLAAVENSPLGMSGLWDLGNLAGN